MKNRYQLIAYIVSFFSLQAAYSVDNFYCPTNHGFIQIGMSQAQVLTACGNPTVKKQSVQPATRKVPVLQLIYNNKDTRNAFYGYWNLSVSQSSGSQLQIDIVQNKVYSIMMNGESTNATSLCTAHNPPIPMQGMAGRSQAASLSTQYEAEPISVGDSASKAYMLCGNPSTTNNSYVNAILSTTEPTYIWTYDLGPYQPGFTLTFVGNQLVSIDTQ